MRQYDRFFIRDSESFNDFGYLAPQLPSGNCNYVPPLAVQAVTIRAILIVEPTIRKEKHNLEPR